MQHRITLTMLTAVAAATATSSASAQNDELLWVVCNAGYESGPLGRFNTKPFQVNWRKERDEIRKKFSAYATNAGMNVGVLGGCSSFRSLDELSDSESIGGSYQSWDRRTVPTALFPGLPESWHELPAPKLNQSAVTERPSSQGTSPGSLVVEENTTARDAFERAEKQRMEMLQKTAADKARMIAVSAASKAERERIMAKVKAEMKKRGNKQ